MEDASQMVQDKPSSLGGNYAPANSCTSSNKELSGLTLPSFEQFHDQIHLGLNGTEDDPFDFDPELERTIFGESYWDNGLTDTVLDHGQVSLTANTVHFEGSQKPTSNHSPSSPSTSEEQIPSHSVFQSGEPSERTGVITISSTSPGAASEPIQELLESESSPSEVPLLAQEDGSYCESIPDASEAHREIRPPTREDSSRRAIFNISFSQPAPNATIVPASGMTGSSPHYHTHHQDPRSFSQAGVYGVISPAKTNSRKSAQQTFPNQAIPGQIIEDRRFQREHTLDRTSDLNYSVRDVHRATDRDWTAEFSCPPPPNSDLSLDSFPRGNRDLIRPELRAAIERFEKKVESDEEVRQAFDIVFPDRSAEVEQLKNTIILERKQAASREKALHKIIERLRLFLPHKDQLETRIGEVAETLLEPPKENPYWMCGLPDLRTNTQPCGGINQEWYLNKTMWILRRKCSKCMRICGVQCRQRVSDNFVKAMNTKNFVKATNTTPSQQSSKSPYKKRKQSQTIDLTRGETYYEAAHRLSLPAVTSIAEANAIRAEASRTTRSLSPHPSAKTKVGTFEIPKSTQNMVRQELGRKDGWIGPHERNDVIDLEGDSEPSGEGLRQEPQVNFENGSNSNDGHERDLEAEMAMALEADLEADMMAECEVAGL